tara:strand:+ start:786 stop:1256 length:471 start_codon:yes stop_codon:yes gene_type:complete
MADRILQMENGVFVFKRQGKRLYSGDLPPDLKPGKKVHMFITSVDVTDFDVTGKIICLNDKRILYEFGKGFGTIQIRGEILVGHKSFQGKNGAKITSLIEWFNQKRVSKNPKPLTINGGRFGGKYKFYLTAFSAGQWNPELGICNFSMTGDLVDMS